MSVKKMLLFMGAFFNCQNNVSQMNAISCWRKFEAKNRMHDKKNGFTKDIAIYISILKTKLLPTTIRSFLVHLLINLRMRLIGFASPFNKR